MNIILVGLNHKTAPVEIREKFSFPEASIGTFLTQLVTSPLISEGLILSTCNRVEIYAITENAPECFDYLSRFIYENQKYHDNISFDQLTRHLYFYSSTDAVSHIFRVSSSLDSMVVGETQISGQIKEAFDYAMINKATGVILNKLFKKAISVAKRIRSQTKISENSVSVSYAAVGLAKKIFGDLTGKTVLLVGAGEMAELAARNLVNNGVKNVLVTNRNYQRAVELAREFNGISVKFDEIGVELAEADIVICSTGAPYYVINSDMVENAVGRRKNRPIFLVDISVPRNIDPKINTLGNVFLYDIDDLQAVVEANLKERQKEAEKAELIIAEEVETMDRWLKSLNVVPTIIAIREKVEAIRKSEVDKTISKWQRELSEEEVGAIENLSQNIINKILHFPLSALKAEAHLSGGSEVIETTRKLFDLAEEKQPSQDPEAPPAGTAESPEEPISRSRDSRENQ
ncbi:MAG: glutamyl-tRNA reductase [Nitrospirae bacterium]|nr:glutamyl-tRNA reductase [Nitrospirota bacterium]